MACFAQHLGVTHKSEETQASAEVGSEYLFNISELRPIIEFHALYMVERVEIDRSGRGIFEISIVS
jgi:hypothetical protein